MAAYQPEGAVFADVPTLEDGLNTPISVGAKQREESANAFALGASAAAAKHSETRAKQALFASAQKHSLATQAQKQAREVVFNAEDAPNTLGALHASAIDVARANSARNEAGPGHSFPFQLNLSCRVYRP